MVSESFSMAMVRAAKNQDRFIFWEFPVFNEEDVRTWIWKMERYLDQNDNRYYTDGQKIWHIQSRVGSELWNWWERDRRIHSWEQLRRRILEIDYQKAEEQRRARQLLDERRDQELRKELLEICEKWRQEAEERKRKEEEERRRQEELEAQVKKVAATEEPVVAAKSGFLKVETENSSEDNSFSDEDEAKKGEGDEKFIKRVKKTQEEFNTYNIDLELKVQGKDVPRPIKFWHQAGIISRCLDTMKKLNYEQHMPIQTQALPIITGGRDGIGVAKTDSGKNCGFVLPMLRHINDQHLVEAGDGPIGLVMAPTRELVQQVHIDIRKFAKPLGIKCVPMYGGSGVAQKISELKRGTELVVCLINIEKITNLQRVTFLVMDEADCMLDMGFETLTLKVLNKAVEIQVSGRSVVNKDITQLAEVIPESDRFLRLLELLGELYEKGKILIFVQLLEKCDALFRDMIKHGYPCLSLHGGKDQTDQESTLSDFKSNGCKLLIVTSAAARGLDVKELEPIVHFDAPTDYGDYVHRVGRTCRTRCKGCAVTFISEEYAKYAPDLVKALELSEQTFLAMFGGIYGEEVVKACSGKLKVWDPGGDLTLRTKLISKGGKSNDTCKATRPHKAQEELKKPKRIEE